MAEPLTIQAAEFRELNLKLYRLYDSLNPRERALLAVMLRAAARPGDVAGYDLSGPNVTVNNLADLEALMQAIARGIGCSVHGMFGGIAG